MAAELPTGLGGLGLSESIFTITQELPYNFGVVTQLLNEVDMGFNTGSIVCGVPRVVTGGRGPC